MVWVTWVINGAGKRDLIMSRKSASPAPLHDVVQRFQFDIIRKTPLGFPIESGLSFIGAHAMNAAEATAMVECYLFGLDKSDGNVSVFTIR